MQTDLIELKNITQEDIKKTLDRYLIDCEIDEDGDVVVTQPMRHYIKIEKEENVLRFFRFIYLTARFKIEELNDPEIDDETKTKLLSLVNDLNASSYFTKYALFRKSIIAEFSIVLDGRIDERSIIKSLQYYHAESISAEKNQPLKDWIG